MRDTPGCLIMLFIILLLAWLTLTDLAINKLQDKTQLLEQRILTLERR